MRHSLSMLSVAAILSASLAACGQSAPPPPQDSKQPQKSTPSGNLRINVGMNPISELELKSLDQYKKLQDNPNFAGPKIQAQAAQRCSSAVSTGNEGEIRSSYSSQNQYYFSVYMFTRGWTNFHVVIQRNYNTVQDYNTPYQPSGYYNAYPGQGVTIQVTATGLGYSYGVLQCVS